jgi:hypothetical protein
MFFTFLNICSLLADFPAISVRVWGRNMKTDVNDMSFTSVLVLCPLTLTAIAGKCSNKVQNTTVGISGLSSLH